MSGKKINIRPYQENGIFLYPGNGADVDRIRHIAIKCDFSGIYRPVRVPQKTNPAFFGISTGDNHYEDQDNEG
jgi:hypothetical protein